MKLSRQARSLAVGACLALPIGRVAGASQDLTPAVSFSTRFECWPPQTITISTTIFENGVPDGFGETQYGARFLDFGAVQSGVYRGGRLILVALEIVYGLNTPEEKLSHWFGRYIELEGRLVRLSPISDQAHQDEVLRQLFRAAGRVVAENSEWTLPALLPPAATIMLGSVELRLYEQLPEDPGGGATILGSHSRYGPMYSAGPFIRAALPDGTVVSYHMPLPSGVLDMAGTLRDSYTCFRPPGKRDASDTPDLLMVDKVIQMSDLRKHKALPGVGVFYVLKDPAASQLLKDGYAEYESDYEDFRDSNSNWRNATLSEFLSFRAYVKRIPYYWWKDGLGRLIRCRNTSIEIPSMAEPLIYLYPGFPMEVSVRLDPVIKVSAAEPAVRDRGWRVMAAPDGWLNDLNGGTRTRHLFWEGKSAPIAEPQAGFVVAAGELESFFHRVLPALGLNDLETGEFVEYWVRKMSSRPFWLIEFIDQAGIDGMAPLIVTPQPDTVIRVMMNARPLSTPINLPEPILPALRPRVGFTLVEWGGLQR